MARKKATANALEAQWHCEAIVTDPGMQSQHPRAHARLQEAIRLIAQAYILLNEGEHAKVGAEDDPK